MNFVLEHLQDFFYAFIPIFVVIDPIGILPNFIGMTEGIEKKRLKKIVIQSMFTASVVSILFLFVGKAILKYLGIMLPDFLIAGGILLFIFAVQEFGDDTTSDKKRIIDPDSVGAVPIGVPLIAGPGLFATSLVIAEQFGFVNTIIAIILNICIAGIIFQFSEHITKKLGHSGEKVIAKLASLLLAAIAVMFVRKGIIEIFAMSKI